MARGFVTTINIVIVLFTLCSCCKIQHGQSVRPEWVAKIPTYESPEIYYTGISNLPKCGNLMIVNTTIYDGGFCAEDNRLCAIDINTGDIKWYFPSDLDERHYCHFDSKSYVYEDKVVFQYAKNYKNSSSRHRHTTTCLDANSGAIIWETEGETPCGNTRPAVGINNECFFVPDKCTVCKADLISNQICDFYHTDDESIHINDLRLSDKLLAISCLRASGEKYKSETSVVVVDAATGTEVFKTDLGRSEVPSHSFIDNNILYSNVDRRMIVTNIITGEKLWERNDTWTYLLMDMYIYKDVLLKCAGNATTGYDKNTGEILYDYRNYGSRFTTLYGKYAYLLNCRGIIDIINVETGEKLNSIRCPQGIYGFSGPYPTVYDNKLYIMGNNFLYRYPTYPWE